MVLTNKQTNKQTKARIEITFWVRTTEENLERLKRAEELAKRDDMEVSTLARNLFFEGVDRHYPGNPSLPLDHWTKEIPFSEAAQEKLTSAPEKEAAPTPTIQPLTKDDLRVWGEATLRAFLNSPKLSQADREIMEHELHVRERRRGKAAP